jgi:hypothetical protein
VRPLSVSYHRSPSDGPTGGVVPVVTLDPPLTPADAQLNTPLPLLVNTPTAFAGNATPVLLSEAQTNVVPLDGHFRTCPLVPAVFGIVNAGVIRLPLAARLTVLAPLVSLSVVTLPGVLGTAASFCRPALVTRCTTSVPLLLESLISPRYTALPEKNPFCQRCVGLPKF